MKAALFTVFYLSFFIVNAQQFFTTCNGAIVGYNTGNVNHFTVVNGCPYVSGDSAMLPKPILNAARTYLLDRVGQDFYPRLKYYGSQTIRPNEDKDCLNGARYALQYYFMVDDTMRYYVSLTMDVNGKVLSRPFLPSVKTNANFAKIINLCAANTIAAADTQQITNKVLWLEYSETTNSFVWVVGSSRNSPYDYTAQLPCFVIHAQTGKVINRIRKRFGFIRDYGEIRKD